MRGAKAWKKYVYRDRVPIFCRWRVIWLGDNFPNCCCCCFHCCCRVSSTIDIEHFEVALISMVDVVCSTFDIRAESGCVGRFPSKKVSENSVQVCLVSTTSEFFKCPILFNYFPRWVLKLSPSERGSEISRGDKMWLVSMWNRMSANVWKLYFRLKETSLLMKLYALGKKTETTCQSCHTTTLRSRVNHCGVGLR